jgi:hypothetical protein
MALEDRMSRLRRRASFGIVLRRSRYETSENDAARLLRWCGGAKGIELGRVRACVTHQKLPRYYVVRVESRPGIRNKGRSVLGSFLFVPTSGAYLTPYAPSE